MAARLLNKKMHLALNVQYTRDGDWLILSGPEGSNKIYFPKSVDIINNENLLEFKSAVIDDCLLSSLKMNFKNAMNGVVKKFSILLNLHGVGYKVVQTGKVLEFFVGYSHTIKINVPSYIEAKVESPVKLVLQCTSNVLLGDFAASIKKLRKVNPYKTKGITSEGQFILKKEGKKK